MIDDVNVSYIRRVAGINLECSLVAGKRVIAGVVAVAMVGDQNAENPADLRQMAMRYRQMAALQTDQRTIDALMSLAAEYEAVAEQLENAHRSRSSAHPPDPANRR